jgi:hypothetical protein
VIGVGTAGLITASTAAPSAPKVPGPAGALTANAPSVQVVKVKSANWSGYEVLGGPYSVIAGDFTVPGMSVGTPVGEQTSEWMGVGQGATSLIQAGVERITLVQQRDAVATSSSLDGDEFRVAYTGPTAFY